MRVRCLPARAWHANGGLACVSRALPASDAAPRTGVPPVLSATGNVGLPVNETTLGQLAKSAGYATAAYVVVVV